MILILIFAIYVYMTIKILQRSYESQNCIISPKLQVKYIYI